MCLCCGWDMVVAQSLSRIQLFAAPWTAAPQASLSFIITWSLLKFMSFESVMPSNNIALSSPSPPVFNISQHQGSFPNELALSTRWPKYWSFSFIIIPSNEYSGLISFRIDCLISLQCRGFSRVFSSNTVWRHQFFSAQPFFGPALTSIHDYWKNHSFDHMDLCRQSKISAF